MDRFFLHVQSGPYFTCQLQHIQITQACIRYLMTCRCFTAGPPILATQSDVVKGFHNLFPCINQYWKFHPLESFKEVSTYITGSEEDCAIQETYHLLLPLIQLMKRSLTERLDVEEQLPEHQTAAAHSLPMALKDLSVDFNRYLAYRKTIIRSTLPPVAPHNAPHPDPSGDLTFFIFAFSEFQHVFENLLAADYDVTSSALSVTKDDLDGFRARHSSSAYRCRWPTKRALGNSLTRKWFSNLL